MIELSRGIKFPKRERENIEFFTYFEKLIEAFPSCVIVSHFLFFETPNDLTDLYLSYLSLIISFLSTSIPPKIAFMNDR
jgi:hypothetical protein